MKFKTIAVCVLVVGTFLLGGMTKTYDKQDVEAVVLPNDTLWNIAERYFDKQDRYDFQEFVYEVSANNNAIIYPGETVKITLYKSK